MKISSLTPHQYSLIVDAIVYKTLFMRFKYCGQIELQPACIIQIEKYAFNNEHIKKLAIISLASYNLEYSDADLDDLVFSIKDLFNQFLISMELQKKPIKKLTPAIV